MMRAIAQRAPAPEDPGAGGHRAAKRALEIIEYVATAPDAVTLTDVAREVDLPKSSAHALLRTLDDEGFLRRDKRGSYSLGPRLLRLLATLPHRFELPRFARPVMEELVQEFDETAILGVRQGAQIVYVEQVEASQYIRYVAPLGEPRPLHCTSIGKLYLAFMAPAEAELLLRNTKLERFTPSTLTSQRALREELDRIREQGYALNREESMSGVEAIAAPIFEGGEAAGPLIAGLSVAGPAGRIESELNELPERVLDAARRIGAGVKPRSVLEA